MKETRTFTRKQGKMTFRTKAYTEDGGKTWRWCSNNAYCPQDACEEYGIPCDPEAQKAARDEQTARFLEEYRRNQPAVPSDEEIAEARAAHGPGVTLVDVFTGRKFTT